MEYPPNNRPRAIHFMDAACRAAICEQWAKAARLWREAAASCTDAKRAEMCEQRAQACESKIKV